MSVEEVFESVANGTMTFKEFEKWFSDQIEKEYNAGFNAGFDEAESLYQESTNYI